MIDVWTREQQTDGHRLALRHHLNAMGSIEKMMGAELLPPQMPQKPFRSSPARPVHSASQPQALSGSVCCRRQGHCLLWPVGVSLGGSLGRRSFQAAVNADWFCRCCPPPRGLSERDGVGRDCLSTLSVSRPPDAFVTCLLSLLLSLRPQRSWTTAPPTATGTGSASPATATASQASSAPTAHEVRLPLSAASALNCSEQL